VQVPYFNGSHRFIILLRLFVLTAAPVCVSPVDRHAIYNYLDRVLCIVAQWCYAHMTLPLSYIHLAVDLKHCPHPYFISFVGPHRTPARHLNYVIVRQSLQIFDSQSLSVHHRNNYSAMCILRNAAARCMFHSRSGECSTSVH